MSNNYINSEFQQILLAAKERRGDLSVDTMIVSSHLAQMRTFMLRRGIEFYAEQDSFGKRREFVSKLCEENMLEMKFELFTLREEDCTGKISQRTIWC